MKASIITPCFNSVKTIRDTIDSVLSQTHPNIEYIIIDGASTDGTVELVQGYGDKISKFVSERDCGIYDAMNKGIALATGDIIGILNSDDFYADEQVLREVESRFVADPALEALYADLVYVDPAKSDRVVRYWHSGEYREDSFERGWHPPHPTFFVRREVYEKYGAFDTRFKIAADYELMLRLVHRYHIRVGYLPRVIVKMRLGGESNRSLANVLHANLESIHAWRANSLSFPWIGFWAKPLRKIPQYFKKAR